MAGPRTRAAPSPGDRSRAFRERARLEADRYGPDPWIFVRELLQNSRDANAAAVAFAVREGGGVETVTCRDNGEGMTFEHARRYLFSLYASSKEHDKSQAGKFGVGFWSVLRFDPATITIRSRTRGGAAWGLRLDGRLEHATEVEPLAQPGTEVTLERAGGDGRLEHRIYDAVWQSARYLHRRRNEETSLPVTVNGREANAEFGLPAPSAAFRRGSVRGVVGLGPAPRVELFSRGLRVRSAACLEDLAAPAGRHTARMRVQFPELPGGLAPQALLESDKLEVMLSRSDARDNRALNRLVRLAQNELERLIDRQVAQARPQPWWRLAYEWAATRLRDSLLTRTAVGSVVGAAAAFVAAWLLWGTGGTATELGGTTAPMPAIAVGAPAGPTSLTPKPYQDLGVRYRGPRVDVLAPGSAEPISLKYRPADSRHHFAALTFSELAEDGSPRDDGISGRLRPYSKSPCDATCIEVELSIRLDSGRMRVPRPTGHRIAEGAFELDGRPIDAWTSEAGHPVIVVADRGDAVLRYKTARAPEILPAPRLRRSPALPRQLQEFAASLGSRPVQERVDLLLALVAQRVIYDRSPGLAQRHAQAVKAGAGFIERTLSIGAGDCDVQNGLLVALLHSAGVPARLAVGFLGVDGAVLPWMHAWVEYRAGDSWFVADASESSGQPLPQIASGRGSADGVVAPSPQGDGGAAVEAGPGPAAVAGTPTTPDNGDPAPAQALSGASEPSLDAPEEPDGTIMAALRSAHRRHPWLLRLIPLALLLAATWAALGRRTRRAIKLDDGADLSRLIQGVLQQPGAFGHMSALLNRPLVPLINGDAISLNRARELASLGRLYRTSARPRIAKRAIKAGAAVLDEHAPESRTVADALGAVDLDRWAVLIERAQADLVTEGVNAALRARGEDWGVRVSHGVPGGLAVLDLGPLGARIPGIRGARLILVDAHTPWLTEVQSLATSNPRRAVFVALDHIADRLDLPPDRRARLLSAGARAALLEAFAGGAR